MKKIVIYSHFEDTTTFSPQLATTSTGKALCKRPEAAWIIIVTQVLMLS